jgi:hypothetical protein
MKLLYGLGLGNRLAHIRSVRVFSIGVRDSGVHTGRKMETVF